MPRKCSPLAQIRREQKMPGPLLLVYFMIISKLDERRGCVTCGCLHILKSQSSEKIKQLLGRKPREQKIGAKSVAPATRRRWRAFHEYGSRHNILLDKKKVRVPRLEWGVHAGAESERRRGQPTPLVSWRRQALRRYRTVLTQRSRSVSQRYVSGSFHQKGRIVRKPLISTVLWLFMTLSVKNGVNVPLKSNRQKQIWHLEGHWRKEQDPEPDPLVRSTDPRIRSKGTHVVFLNF